jgi:16S rRNA (uracil1498-N3)-methyltransferase
MAEPRIMLDQFPDRSISGGFISVGGEEAHHAVRVRRVEAGDRVTLMDGRGRVASASVSETRKDRRSGEWEIVVKIESERVVARATPEIEVFAAAPKGDRLAEMIDGLSQVGAARWRPLVTERTVVEPREGKIDRLHRVAREACKQSGRAWELEIGAAMTLADALRSSGWRDPSGGTTSAAMSAARVVTRGEDASGVILIVADASGEGYRWEPAGAGRAGPSSAGDSHAVRLLIGPEGGWSESELESFRACGARVCRFGWHVMRIETAAVAAAAIVMHEHARVR